MSTWNNIFEYRDGVLVRRSTGKVVGSRRPDGYIQVSHKSRCYLAHRIIFEMHHGRPPAVIDHVNRHRFDNRIENLRECSFSENNHNRAPKKESAAKNVSFNKRIGKWYVRVRKDNKVYCGKYHACLEGAIAEANQLRLRLHGEFASQF